MLIILARERFFEKSEGCGIFQYENSSHNLVNSTCRSVLRIFQKNTEYIVIIYGQKITVSTEIKACELTSLAGNFSLNDMITSSISKEILLMSKN